jgi:hypothetical protein
MYRDFVPFLDELRDLLECADKQKGWAGDIRAAYLAAHPELTPDDCNNLSQQSSWWIDQEVKR